MRTMMLFAVTTVITVGLILFSPPVNNKTFLLIGWAGESKDSTAETRESLEIGDRIDREKREAETREALRDKTHDNRIKIDDKTSVGIDHNGVNVKRSLD